MHGHSDKMRQLASAAAKRQHAMCNNAALIKSALRWSVLFVCLSPVSLTCSPRRTPASVCWYTSGCVSALCAATTGSCSVLGRADIDFYRWPQGCSLEFCAPLSQISLHLLLTRPPFNFFSPLIPCCPLFFFLLSLAVLHIGRECSDQRGELLVSHHNNSCVSCIHGTSSSFWHSAARTWRLPLSKDQLCVCGCARKYRRAHMVYLR